VPKKARVLTKEQVEKFLVEAPDDYWLLYKMITIFGIFGACRCDELLSLTVKDVEDVEKYIIVTLRNTKNLTRRFTITDEGCSLAEIRIVHLILICMKQRNKNVQMLKTLPSFPNFKFLY
jgi:integrase